MISGLLGEGPLLVWPNLNAEFLIVYPLAFFSIQLVPLHSQEEPYVIKCHKRNNIIFDKDKTLYRHLLHMSWVRFFHTALWRHSYVVSSVFTHVKSHPTCVPSFVLGTGLRYKMLAPLLTAASEVLLCLTSVPKQQLWQISFSVFRNAQRLHVTLLLMMLSFQT